MSVGLVSGALVWTDVRDVENTVTEEAGVSPSVVAPGLVNDVKL